MYLQNYYPINNQWYRYIPQANMQQYPANMKTYPSVQSPYQYPNKPGIDLNDPSLRVSPPTYRADETPYLQNGLHGEKLYDYHAKKGDIDRFLELYSFDTGNTDLRKSYLKHKNSPELNTLFKSKLFNNEKGVIRLAEIVEDLDKQTTKLSDPASMSTCLTSINNFVNSNLSVDLKQFMIFGTDHLKNSNFCRFKLVNLNPANPDLKTIYHPDDLPGSIQPNLPWPFIA